MSKKRQATANQCPQFEFRISCLNFPFFPGVLSGFAEIVRFSIAALLRSPL
jgi:hypothetical protein